MTKQEYKQYLRSADWLLKKNRCLNYKIEKGIPIECLFCNSTNDLQFHHLDYKWVGIDEIGEFENIVLACKDCHYNWHFNKQWMENFIRKGIDDISEWMTTLSTA